MQLQIHPKETLIDEGLSIKVTGLSASADLTMVANEAAAADGWPKILEFLDENLR